MFYCRTMTWVQQYFGYLCFCEIIICGIARWCLNLLWWMFSTVFLGIMWRIWTGLNWNWEYGAVSKNMYLLISQVWCHSNLLFFVVLYFIVYFISGDVVLENLVLKQNALEELNIPVQTVYGHLGKWTCSWKISLCVNLCVYYGIKYV